MRAAIVTVLVALLIVPALAWLSYRALRALATGIVLLILWSLG